MFCSHLEDFESITIDNTLANNTFQHQIILDNKTVLSIIITISYTFNLSTKSKYNDTKFKGLLFILDTST